MRVRHPQAPGGPFAALVSPEWRIFLPADEARRQSMRLSRVDLALFLFKSKERVACEVLVFRFQAASSLGYGDAWVRDPIFAADDLSSLAQAEGSIFIRLPQESAEGWKPDVAPAGYCVLVRTEHLESDLVLSAVRGVLGQFRREVIPAFGQPRWEGDPVGGSLEPWVDYERLRRRAREASDRREFRMGMAEADRLWWDILLPVQARRSNRDWTLELGPSPVRSLDEEADDRRLLGT
jgi:hypothetical protein